jgi:hypothetical protein
MLFRVRTYRVYRMPASDTNCLTTNKTQETAKTTQERRGAGALDRRITSNTPFLLVIGQFVVWVNPSLPSHLPSKLHGCFLGRILSVEANEVSPDYGRYPVLLVGKV